MPDPAPSPSLDDSAAFRVPSGESLSLLELPTPELETLAGARARCFEFSCRGDRARLDLLCPDAAGPFPTLLVQPRPERNPELASQRGLRTWLSAGIAVASLTLPLFGGRRSPKFSSKLTTAIEAASTGRELHDTDRILWSEFARQSVLELRRAVDVLTESWGAAPGALVFAGSGIGAAVGAVFCALDERPRAAALTPLANAPAPPEPGHYLERIAPRALHALEGDDPELLDACWPLLSPECS